MSPPDLSPSAPYTPPSLDVAALPRTRLAQAIQASVTGLPGVARMSAGRGTEVATQYRGGKIIGVWLRDQRVEVHIVAAAVPLPPLCERAHQVVQDALDAVGDARSVLLVVDDIVLGEEATTASGGTETILGVEPSLPADQVEDEASGRSRRAVPEGSP